MHAAVYHLEAQALVRLLRYGIVNQCIGSHLNTSLASRPFFRRSRQLGSYPLPPIAFPDKPAFNEPDWEPRVAAVCMRAQSNFNEANQRTVLAFSHEDNERQRSDSFSAKNCRYLSRILLVNHVWPQLPAKLRKLLDIGRRRKSDVSLHG